MKPIYKILTFIFCCTFFYTYYSAISHQHISHHGEKNSPAQDTTNCYYLHLWENAFDTFSNFSQESLHIKISFKPSTYQVSYFLTLDKTINARAPPL